MLAIIGDQVTQFEKEKARLATLQQWIGKKLANELVGAQLTGQGDDLGEYEICRKEIGSLATQSNETLEASQAEVI